MADNTIDAKVKALATRIGKEFKTLRSEGGGGFDLSDASRWQVIADFGWNGHGYQGASIGDLDWNGPLTMTAPYTDFKAILVQRVPCQGEYTSLERCASNIMLVCDLKDIFTKNRSKKVDIGQGVMITEKVSDSSFQISVSTNDDDTGPGGGYGRVIIKGFK